MSFTSYPFIVFFAGVCITYFLVHPKYRWVLLLGASYFFYGTWNLAYLILIAVCTIGNYRAGIGIDTSQGRRRNVYFFIGLASSLGILFTFKYINFFNNILINVFGIFGQNPIFPDFPFLLPLGISFYTLQALGYTIDVFRGKREPEHHLGIFALYVSFFPQLLAGPIERSTSLLPQFREIKIFNAEDTAIGLRLILWGFFKKLVIADRLAVIVDTVYANPMAFDGPTLLMATYLFSIQIFCDFSAYTDIARGIARIMGFELMENFRRPYLAASVSDFWRRWHISLSSWFRDYLYIPLGGNRVARWRRHINLLIVFLVSGLWHGANWTFVLWGLLHGIYLAAELTIKDLLRAVPWPQTWPELSGLKKILKVLCTYHFVIIGWVLFRSKDWDQAVFIFGKIFSRPRLTGSLFPGLEQESAVISVLAVGCVLLSEVLLELRYLEYRIPPCPAALRWVAYLAGTWAIFLYGWMEPYTFIYFVF